MSDPVDDDDELDGPTAISDPNALNAMLNQGPGRTQQRAAELRPAAPPQRPTPVPSQPPRRPTPVPRQSTVPDPAAQQRAEASIDPPPRGQTQQGMDARQRTTPNPVAARGPQAKALQRTDIVPEFRRDLRIARSPGGVQIESPTNGEIHTLNEYEVSLARMLNGKRPVFEVIEASERLGIPINVESLQKFIDKLEVMGFLQPAESLDAAVENAWPSRGQWENSVRTLFQSGIRFLRQGKPQEAIGYFEAMLAEDPQNEEAKELLAMARQALASPQPTIVVPGPPSAVGYALTPSGPLPVVNPYAQPTMSPPGGYPMQSGPISQIQPIQGHDPSQHGYAPQPYGMQTPYPPQMYPQIHAGAPVAPMYAAPAASPVPKKLVIAGLAALVLLGAAIGFAVLRSSNDKADKVAQTDTTGSAAAGSAAAGSAAAGSAAATGSAAVVVPPATGSATAGSAGPAATGSADLPEATGSAAVGSADAGATTSPDGTGSAAEPPQTGSGATGGKKTPDTTDADEPKKTPAVDPVDVEAPMGGDLTSYLRSARKVRKGEKLFSIRKVSGDPAKIKQLSAKVAEMQQLAKEDPIYKEFLTTAKRDLAKERKVTSAVVTAPRAGKATPRAKNGATVRSGQTLAVIE